MNSYLPQLLLSLALASTLGAQVSAPIPGFARNGALPIKTIYGVAGSLVANPSMLGSADALAFADRFGIIAAGGEVKMLRSNGSDLGHFETRENHPVLNLDSDPASAVAWLPESHSLLFWNNNQWQQVAVEGLPEGATVTSVTRDSANSSRLLLTQTDASVLAVTIALPQGSVISIDLLPGVRGPAFQFGSKLIWANEQDLDIGSPSGAVEHTLPLPAAGVFSAERMSSQWVHLYFPAGGGTHWALHLGDKPTLSRIPMPATGVTR